ncbi:MAG: DUF4870 domain-containing protein [Gammaproteobacteria bacterium]|nr:DUF4870 domain-containing protein [Gammaproteobacteria bacterium]MDH5628610.1 DUF4870 domain-containing protein [Gammaproteobacteria bacterium]
MSQTSSVSQREIKITLLCQALALVGLILPLCNILFPFLLWKIFNNQSAFIDRHGRAIIDFQITITLSLFIAVLLTFVSIGIPFIMGLIAFNIGCIIIAMIKANNGLNYAFPFSLELMRKSV